jgi:hypothetical protein
MSIIIIKSGTTAIAGATVKGSFSYFSGSTKDLGPTSSTGFYSGIDSPIGGFTVYQIGGSTGWTARVATDTTGLNSILLGAGGTGVTVDQNITWANNSNNVFITTGTTQFSNLFTPAGATGVNGPTLTQCQTAYAGQSFLSGNFSVSSGKQILTITKAGSYTVRAIGGGGADSYPPGVTGGLAASMQGTFTFNVGDTITMVVGQKGISANNACIAQNGGGGGGSFVLQNGTLILAAGGGGGASKNGDTNIGNGYNASTGTTGVSGQYAGGSGGGGGTTTASILAGNGGGGYTGNGASSGFGGGGLSYTNNATGGLGYSVCGGDGGFGGGAGQAYDGGGGGGGYSGGGAGGNGAGAGGGGSYNTGTNQVNLIVSSNSDGSILIQL